MNPISDCLGSNQNRAWKQAGLMDLPVELHLRIIHFLDPEEDPSIVSSGCSDMRDKWALKRVNWYWFAFEELHAPIDFFVRQYRNISLDRVKQQRLAAAFQIHISWELGAVQPCFECRRFMPAINFYPHQNAAPFFYEHRETFRCYSCTGLDTEYGEYRMDRYHDADSYSVRRMTIVTDRLSFIV